MQFIVIGRDGTDEGALDRRLKARDAHLAGVAKLAAEGKQLLGVAMVNAAGKMCGSVMLFDMKDRAELDAYQKTEPYVIQKVWQDIEISEGKVAPVFQEMLNKIRA
jgi:uncharacterized protein YciI